MQNQRSDLDRTGQRFRHLRRRWKRQQDSLRAEFQQEIGKIPADDVVSSTRLRLKFRQKGLNI